MAKLSVYNTIDRSQLGGKFVPLIQSGVNNYKILASDLGKEYSPGDAIEITDTGVINVNYDPFTLTLLGSKLGVRTDSTRGVFMGSGGIYIASADSSIGISNGGIKVNTESLIGPGLELHAGNMIAVKTNAPLYSDNSGIRLAIGGGLYVDSGALYLNSSVVSDAAVIAVHNYFGTYLGSSLSNDSGYLVVNTKYIASAGLTTGGNKYNPISVDVKYVANAIGAEYIGSGLSWDSNNYRLSANVNTSTGIIVKDNKLYLNAGAGLHTTNNSVRVQIADETIGVSGSGIRVNYGYGLAASSIFDGLTLKGLNSNHTNLDLTIYDYDEGYIYANAYKMAGSGLVASRRNSAGAYTVLNVKPADGSIFVTSSGIGVDLRNAMYVGSGLTNSIGELAVKAADTTIGVSMAGIQANCRAILDAIGNTYIGSGLKYEYGTLSSALYAGSGARLEDNYISVYAGSGLGITNSGVLYVHASSLAGGGLVEHVDGGMLQVRSADRTIFVNHSGIGVNPGYGLSATSEGLYVKSADSSIGVDYNGIGVRLRSGGGLLTGNDGLYVDSGKLAGRGLTAHIEQHNVKLNVNVGQYDLSSNNRSSNLLKLDTATNALYVGGVDITGIIGTNNTMTRQQDPTSYYHSFGVDVDYLFSTYTDRATLIYSGHKLSVHLSSIAGDGLGYDSTRKAIYVTSGGSMRGVAVSTPNNTAAYVGGEGAIAIGESAVTGGDNSIAIGRFIRLDSGSTESIAIGYTASAIGYGSVSLGARASSSANLSVAIGYNAKSSGGIAIGYEASASDGMMSLTVYHSSGTCFNYSYDKDGNLCYYHNSGNSYTRSWKNLLTPPNYSTAVSINTNTEYTADRPAYIAFNVYAGGTSGYVVEFIKNSVTVFNVGVLYGLTVYNIIPVSKGDKYKLNITDYGATNPAVYAYRIYPS